MEQISVKELNEKIEKLRGEFEKMKEDLEFARRTDEAYDRIKSGEYISVDSDDLVEEMSKW
jgi:outer membrane murein-binding lipoprotein Lpp